MMFVDCPAYLDRDGAARCGLPAEVRCRYILRSTDGPLESAMIRCPVGHWFNGPIESFTWDSPDNHDPGAAAAGSRAERDSLPGTHDGGDGAGGCALRDYPAVPDRTGRRPNAAPAYYLGQPASLWITLMRPRRRHTASSHCVESHLRHLLEEGFEVAVVRDATAAPRLAAGDAYLAALTNYAFLAHAVWMTEEAVSHIRGGA